MIRFSNPVLLSLWVLTGHMAIRGRPSMLISLARLWAVRKAEARSRVCFVNSSPPWMEVSFTVRVLSPKAEKNSSSTLA
jgi:hypothetical protein